MGGFLAQPAKFYPSVFSEDGIFGRYPYLLPNLFAVGAIVLAIIQGIIFLEETNPALKAPEPEDDGPTERTPILRGTARDRARSSISRASFRDRSNSVIAAIREVRKRPSFLEESMPLPIGQGFDIRRSSFGTMHSVRMKPSISNLRHEHRPAPVPVPAAPKKTFNYGVIMLTLSLVIICYHQMAFISTIPIWVLDKPATPFGQLDLRGGLGFTLPDVGTYLAINGFIALFIQSVLFPLFVERVGVWKSFIWMIVLYPTCYIFMPFISALPTRLVSPGVYLSFILQDFYGIILFPCALILLKNATPSPLVLGKVNGMAMSACCLARTVSPPLVGLFYSLGGSAAAWWSLAVVSFIGVVQLIWIPREHVEDVEVESGIRKGSFRHSYSDQISEQAVEDY